MDLSTPPLTTPLAAPLTAPLATPLTTTSPAASPHPASDVQASIRASLQAGPRSSRCLRQFFSLPRLNRGRRKMGAGHIRRAGEPALYDYARTGEQALYPSRWQRVYRAGPHRPADCRRDRKSTRLNSSHT